MTKEKNPKANIISAINKKLDMLLIVPPFSYGRLRETGHAFPPLGIASIAAVLEQKKYSVKILDAVALELNEEGIERKIRGLKPKIVGISSVTAEFPKAMSLFKLVKKVDSSITTILGGPHATIMPETANSELIDYLVIGEGEETITELLSYLFGNRDMDLSKIKGIAYRKGNKLIINEPRELIGSIDEIPFPAYHLLPIDKYKPHIMFDPGLKFTTLITSRGCPFSCTFCTSSSVFGHKWRSMSAERVVELIKMLYKDYGIRHFYFHDDEFTISRKRTEKICDLINENGLKIIWECLSRVDSVDEKLIKKMYDSGCRGILYGIEVGYQKGLNRINKKITIEQAQKAVAATKKHGIFTSATFIIGFPWEGRKEVRKTIAFSRSLDIDVAFFQVLTPYPGTKMYEDVKKEGIVVSNDWKQFVQYPILGTRPLIGTKYLTKKELERWNAWAFLSFYLRPRFILKKLLKRNTNLKRRLKAAFVLMGNAVMACCKPDR